MSNTYSRLRALQLLAVSVKFASLFFHVGFTGCSV